MNQEEETEDFRRLLGKAGETCLRALAVKFYVTRPEEDFAGWDFLIEADDSSPGPHTPGKVRAWVQVKTYSVHPNRKSRPRVQIKLSNWKQALESDPWFFLVVEANEQAKPQRAWLVHFSNTWIKEVIKRAAEDKGSDRKAPKLELTWEDADELPSTTDAEAFESRIRDIIGHDLDSYRLKKRLSCDEARFGRFDMGGTRDLVPWNALRSRLPLYVSLIKREWEKLLTSPSAAEKSDILQFLRDHAGFLLCDGGRQLVAISDLDISADLRPDFVLPYDNLSAGYLYELVKCETPSDILFTDSGTPSETLERANHQISLWKRWIEENREQAKKIFPSSDSAHFDILKVNYTLIIGRREKDSLLQARRNHYADQWNVKICSFDHLTERLARQPFSIVPILPSSEMNGADTLKRNAIANPFRKAIDGVAWQRITPGLRLIHTTASSLDDLVRAAEVHCWCRAFIKDTLSLPPEVRRALLAEANHR